MVSQVNVVVCAVAALAFWTALGWPICRRSLSSSLALPFAPIAGWAVHSVVALLVFFVIPFTRLNIALVAVAMFAIVWFVARKTSAEPGAAPRAEARVSRSAWAGAAAIAIVVAWAILPKVVGDAVILSDPIFDHSKISMVDDMARLGLPPGNPYFAADGGSGRLTYYYLLHFSDAQVARLLHASGWEADVATTFFAAFTSLAAMMGLAVKFSGRSSASLWVLAFATTSSARVVLRWVFGDGPVLHWIANPGGFGGWFFQSSWVPQHLVSTTCVLLSVALMHALTKRRGPLPIVALALSIAAGFESSTWVGGVVFALVAVVVVPLLALRTEASRRGGFLVALGATALLVIGLTWPFFVDQLGSAAIRQHGSPIIVRAFDVFGRGFAKPVRDLLDGPGFWLVLLPIELGAAYLFGLFALVRSIAKRRPATSNSALIAAFAATGLVALAAAAWLVSTFADNNDLSWRAGLLGAAVLIVFAAAALAKWSADRRRFVVAVVLVFIALGLPETWLQMRRNVDGHLQAEGVAFARMPALWSKVREHAAPDERVANNPQAFANMTPWPVNIAWSLLADRRSCYAGWELTQVFTAVPHDRLRTIDALFRRVFAGDASPGDVDAMATTYQCRVVAVTSDDGAWTRDPFRDSAAYRLVDEDAAHWRIYRIAD